MGIRKVPIARIRSTRGPPVIASVSDTGRVDASTGEALSRATRH